MDKTNKIISIHQPDFLPWPGFFNKYHNSDIFVINDYGQWPKNKTCYTNRVGFLVQSRIHNFTIPVIHSYHGYRSFKEMQIDNKFDWRKKLWLTIQTNYSKTEYFRDYRDFIRDLIIFESESIVDYNLYGIKKIIELLGMDQEKLIIGSAFIKANDLVKTEKVIEVVKAFNGTAYLSGSGATEYMKDELFRSCNLELYYNDFMSHGYERQKMLTPGLSIIDPLFRIGLEHTKILTFKKMLKKI